VRDAGVDAAEDVTVVERPTPGVAADAIEVGIERGRVVTLVGRCVVRTDQDGAVEDAGHGDRHVFVKPDGSLVVHAGSGVEPLHRVGGGDGPDVAVVDGRLRIGGGEGHKRARIEFERVELLARFRLGESPGSGRPAQVDAPTGHESLRQRLLESPDIVEPGFRALSTERETAAGPIDVFGRDAEGRAVVVEVKAHRAGPAAVGQLDRYVEALGRDLHADAEVRGVLVAPSATERTRTLLAERGHAFRALSTGG